MQKRVRPILQVALDFTAEEKALETAEMAIKGGADWLEAGTPLIKSEGIRVVRALKTRFPDRVIVADLKTLDSAYVEAEMASANGADVVTVSGLASRRTVTEAIEGARKNGAKVMADLLWVKRAEEADRALALQQLGVDYVCVHVGSEDLPAPSTFLESRAKDLENLVSSLRLPLAVAGRLDPGSSALVGKSGAAIVVVGSYINSSPNPAAATSAVIRELERAAQGRTHKS